MCQVIRAAVLVLSLAMISCSATPSTIMTLPKADSNRQSSAAPTSAAAEQAKRASASQVDEVGAPLSALRATAKGFPGDSTSGGVLLMVVDHGSGVFYETRSNLSILRQNDIAVTNGGDVSLEARGSPGITAIVIDTGFSLVSMREIAPNRWHADFQYLNLNNDPSVPPVMRLLINQNGQSLKQEIPIRILHDS